ncbi:hypothetical protein B0H17DRAFT_1207339 [Mycena rosella]|uniref:Uncharacterized protein n=1 Tax=Mycena rosella TaxID=1033263 RepID=A0AAD7D302_MYCRO|nr:hypothetical protein B0H17DRAFT_1207339 [Mycena rosella]
MLPALTEPTRYLVHLLNGTLRAAEVHLSRQTQWLYCPCDSSNDTGVLLSVLAVNTGSPLEWFSDVVFGPALAKHRLGLGISGQALLAPGAVSNFKEARVDHRRARLGIVDTSYKPCATRELRRTGAGGNWARRGCFCAGIALPLLGLRVKPADCLAPPRTSDDFKQRFSSQAPRQAHRRFENVAGPCGQPSTGRELRPSAFPPPWSLPGPERMACARADVQDAAADGIKTGAPRTRERRWAVSRCAQPRAGRVRRAREDKISIIYASRCGVEEELRASAPLRASLALADELSLGPPQDAAVDDFKAGVSRARARDPCLSARGQCVTTECSAGAQRKRKCYCAFG